MQGAPASMEAPNYFHVRVLSSTYIEVGSRPGSMEVASRLGLGLGLELGSLVEAGGSL